MTTLQGITWNHSRGLVPLVATAQRFCETHAGVEIVWQKRSLQEFADFPIQKLAQSFDLLVIDHPFSGFAAARHAEGNGPLLPLDSFLDPDFLADQARNSVGASHRSYNVNGHQWALAIDAATPIAAWREDALKKHGVGVPQSWDELVELARRGLVTVPSIPIDSLMNFYCLVLAHDGELFQNGEVASEAAGVTALQRLRELTQLCSPDDLTRNPIATFEALSYGDSVAYCPFLYGYSNYGRAGYAPHQLQFGPLVNFGKNRLRSTLGGTGLAISSSTQNRDLALQYAEFVACETTQKTLYLENGGQSGHRAAWLDERANSLTNNFFRDTLSTLDDAYLRPRYDGYLDFQDRAGPIVHRFLSGHTDNPLQTLSELNALFALHPVKNQNGRNHD